jgi:hypothetical protein
MPHPTCSVDGCESKVRCKSLCNKHYLRLRNHGDPLFRFKPEGRQACTVEDCAKFAAGHGLCQTHYMRLKRTGSTADPVRVPLSCQIDGCVDAHYGRGYCSKHYHKWYAHGNASHRLPGEVVGGMKICASCRADLPVEEYGIDKSVKSGRSIYCRGCVSKKVSAWYLENREQVREYSRLYAKRNPHLVLAKVQRRNARKLEQFVEDVDRLSLANRDGWRCGICSEEIGQDPWPHPRSLSVDHVIPLSRGGAHGYANTQAAHLSCNIGKGAKIAA